MTSTLLLVAYSFPPENVSGAARPHRFFRYLPEQGITPVVITATPQPAPQPDIVFVQDDARDLPRQSWSWQVERVLRKTLFPGEMGLTWSLKAARACRDLAANRGRVAVLSTSPPFSAHLAALRVQGQLGIPWVADFRDPMYPFREKLLDIYSPIESFLLRRADAVIANTDRASDELRRRYPHAGEKLNVVWNGFDPAEPIVAAPLPERDFVQWVHVGDIYAGRHPGPILSSVGRLLAAGALSPGALRISLIGTSVEEEIPDLDTLRNLISAGVVAYTPNRVPQAEARRVATQADGLLLLQPQSETQVPAKIFEYIRIGRPVLAYLMPGSPSEKILAASGIPHRVVHTGDPPDTVDRKLLEFLALPNDPVAPSDAFREQFDARSHAKTLANLIVKLHAASG